MIVLDPGHTLEKPGAIGILGKKEVIYNNDFTAELAKQLRSVGYTVILTRNNDQKITLNERVDISNQIKPALFLSIHHDSAQMRYLEKNEKTNGYKTIKPINGFSLFVSRLNMAYDTSVVFATKIGESLVSINRLPTLHHAEMIEGESKELIKTKFGVYNYDNLVVLKNNRYPSVLLEIGLIVDEQDELYISTPKNIKKMCDAIVLAIQKVIPLK